MTPCWDFGLWVDFLYFQLLTFLLIITWTQAADELKNPFRTNPGYDVDLVKRLNVNLWRTSLMLQNQQESLHRDEGGGKLYEIIIEGNLFFLSSL